MLKIFVFFSFAIIFVNTQESELNQACGSQTTNNNYYYSKDANPVAGPSIQPPADVLQGRPGKVGPRGFKGDRGDQGEPGVPDNSVVELFRSELANLTMRLTNVENQNRELTAKLQKRIKITTNCNENDVTTSGVYYIRANLRLNAVYCEVEAVGRNWLVFQQRLDGTVDFYRKWREYQHGFGNVEGNYWLGLDAIRAITSSGSYQLRVDLEDWENDTAYALYRSFSVGDESSNYRLNVSGYSGTAGDSLNYHNNQQFSTNDQDNDQWDRNCAASFHGGWWYHTCVYSNLNGEYQRGLNEWRANCWHHWKNNNLSLKRSVMKIKPS